MGENGLDDVPFDWIAEDLRKGEIIPFLGAGASVFPRDPSSKPPSASSLAQELARESRHPQFEAAQVIEGDFGEATLEQRLRARLDCANLALVASWVEHVKGDRPRLRQKLRQRLVNERLPFCGNDLHDLLAQAAHDKPMTIVTTNYDDLMEEALRKREVPFDLFVVAIDRVSAAAEPQGVILFRSPGEATLHAVKGEDELLDIEIREEAVQLKRTVLFKIHGHVDRARKSDDTFVITEEDYVTFLGRMGAQGSLIPADLVTLMRSRRLLFLGYGLRDWNLRVLLDRLTRMRGAAHQLRSFAIARNIGPGERELWDRRGVSVYNTDLGDFVQRLGESLTPGGAAPVSPASVQ